MSAPIALTPAPLTIGPLNELPAVRHAFFTREGGVSEGLYSSLNCGFGSGDRREHVAENRKRALAAVELEAQRLVTCYQIHSDRAVAVRAPWRPEEAPQADALVTRTPGIALGVLTADCAPVLLADAEAAVIAAAHAGWKGALAGVLENTVAAMEALGARRPAIVAGIGPAIEGRSYEVGPEFPLPFLAQSPENADFFRRGPGEKLRFDLKGYAARRLVLAGVGKVQILPSDTCAESARFFSYRRSRRADEPDYGRGLSTIHLEP